MRPLKIEMSAFGPYKEKESIDFSKLAHHQLFVISGPTGAGKTTVFDAICFALYGTASGSDRQNISMLRSHFADDDVHTSVSFIFRLREKTYRVFRQLGHKKAGNKTATGEKYELYEILADNSEVPAVERQIVTEINKKLEQLIGLTEDQFKQIVMLPQGEFRKLLTSETENKEAILRRLFKTEKYKQFNLILQEKRDHLLRQFTEEKKMLNHFMDQVTAVTEVREGSPLALLLQQETYNSGQVVEALLSEWEFLCDKERTERQAYETAQQSYENQLAVLNESINLNEKFVQKEQKEASLQQLLKQTDNYKQKETTLEAANEAAKIMPYETQLKERKTELTSYIIKQKDLEEKNVQVKKLYEQAVEMYEKEVMQEGEREKLKREVDRLESFLPIVEQMAKNEKRLEEQRKQIEQNRVTVEGINKKISENERQLDAKKHAIESAEAQLKSLGKIEEKLHALREKYHVVNEFHKIHDQAMESKGKLNRAQTIFTEEKEKYNQLESVWFNQQAVVLASHLHDGEACPVCGSSDHPNKATNNGASITKEQIEEKKQYMEKLEQRLKKIEQSHFELEGRWKMYKQKMDEYELSIKHLDETKATIKQEGQQLKDTIDKLKLLEKEYDTNRKAIGALEEDIKVQRKKKEELDQKYAEINAIYRSETSLFIADKKEIPEEIQQIDRLRSYLQKTRSTVLQKEEQFKRAETNMRETEKEHLSVTQSIQYMKEMIQDAQKKVTELEETFQSQLARASFETVEDYESAKLQEDDRNQLQQEIQAYYDQKSLVEHQLEELNNLLQHKQKVDTTVLKTEVEQLKTTYEHAFEKLQKTKHQSERVHELKENIEELSTRVKGIEEEVVVVEDVYDAIRGQNNLKISFERYLQIDYLDQITQAANERFHSLTNGQYYLIRSERQETHGRQSGLAIDVYDAYTGLTRDVKTLSGGEKFIASLCLALGMSDVIQSFQGGVSIETMFIDEGFGSLDDESLQKAIDALVQLQQSGRMIGVISHVEELKSIFPAMLEVTKTKEGYSKTAFKIK